MSLCPLSCVVSVSVSAGLMAAPPARRPLQLARMLMLRHGVVACVCLAACVAAEDFLEPEETGVKPSTLERQKITFSLEHDVSGTGGAFTKRNEVMYEAVPGAKRNRPTVRVSKFAFTPEEVESIEQLARSGGVYRIRAPTSIQGGTENYVMSYVPACALVASRYTEHLVFHLGRNGNILGVDLSTPNTDCSAVTATPPRKGQGKKVQVSSTVRVDLGMDAEKSVAPCSPARALRCPRCRVHCMPPSHLPAGRRRALYHHTPHVLHPGT
eukprot:COSAG03_NODE_1599_length_3807_cov_7.276699_5_plen_269_part_00